MDAIHMRARGDRCKSDALVVELKDSTGTRNSAGRVSEPRLAQIQHICAIASGTPSIPYQISAADFQFAHGFRSRHIVRDH